MTASSELSHAVGDTIFVEQGNRLHTAKVLELDSGVKGEDVFVHYLGWSSKWDNWAPLEHTRKITEESIAEQARMEEAVKQSTKKNQKKRDATGESKERAVKDVESASEAAAGVVGAAMATMTAELKALDEGEAKVSSSLVPALPSGLRRRLVLDWEWLTRKNYILRLPARLPVVTLLAAFLHDQQQQTNTAQSDEQAAESSTAKDEAVLQVCEGLMCYFERCLPAVLLYRIERPQMEQLAKQHKLTVLAPGQSNPSPAPLFSLQHMTRTLPRSTAAQSATSSSSSSSSSASSPSTPPSALVRWLPEPSADDESFAAAAPQWSGLYGVEHLVRLLCKLPAILRDREGEWLPDQTQVVKYTLTQLFRWLNENADLIYSYSAHEQTSPEYMEKLQQPNHTSAKTDEQQPSSGNDKVDLLLSPSKSKSRSKRKVH